MSRNWIRSLAALMLLGLTAPSAAMAQAEAEAEAKKTPPPVSQADETAPGSASGIIQAISEDGKIVTIVTPKKGKKKPAATVELKLNDATKIRYVDVQERKLKPGVMVRAALDAKDKTLATRIAVSQPPDANLVLGVIKNVSADGKTLEIEAQKGKKKSKKAGAASTVKLTDQTKVEYLGIESKDEQALKAGYFASIALDPKTKDATTLKAAKDIVPLLKAKNKAANPKAKAKNKAAKAKAKTTPETKVEAKPKAF